MATTITTPVRRGNGWWRWFWRPILILVVLFALYTFAMMQWSYSDGERVGVVQKFSRKGYICKTYEGELALYVVGGLQPTIFDFTVRDEATAKKLMAVGGDRVSVHYKQHMGLPTSCFGDTQYWVDEVHPLEQQSTPVSPGATQLAPVAPAPAAPAATPAAPPATH